MQNVLKTSWRRPEEVLKTYGLDKYNGLDQDVLKTSSEDKDQKAFSRTPCASAPEAFQFYTKD